MKRIIDIDEKDYEVIKRECSNKDVVPIGWVQILNGKPLQTEYEEIKSEIDEKTKIHLDGEFYIKNFDVKRILDKHMEELRNE